MSLLSDTNSLESAIQPSLVYPSLFQNGRKHQQTRPSLNKYYSLETTKDELSSTLSSQDNVQTTKELQACIHFASRLIKLRSELRSPSYMRTSPSTQQQHQDYFNSQQQQQHYNKSPPLSEVGRVHSLPNVSQYIQQEEQHHHPYEKKLNFCEDESEIVSLNSNSSTDEASQLTYLSELKRRSSKNNNKKESRGGGLNLPPKYQLSNHRNLSNIPPSSALKHRSLSLHDMIHEVVDEAINNSNKPMKRERFSSLALASQLIYASSSKEKKKEKQEESKEVVLNEKVQLDQESRFLSSIKKDTTAISTTYVTPAIIDTIDPQPSQSRDTNKSLFSTLSSDSEGEEDAHHKRTLINKRRPTAAFLVSISPSSAAAATVAKSRRNNKQTRTKLTQVYSSSSSSKV